MPTTPAPDPDQIARLTEGIRAAAKLPSTDKETPAEYWQRATLNAFDRAGIPLTEAEFDRAWHELWHCAFMGGNYTLDATRVLRAVAGGDR